MAVNPMHLLKMKERLSLFSQDHPRVGAFMAAAREEIRPGTVLELRVTTPEGKEMVTNIRVNENDAQTLKMLRELNGGE